jgi:DNA-binding MarR family transcriptional regulator
LTHPDLDDPNLRAWRDQTLYRLLLRASRAETTTTLHRVHEAGYDDVSLVDTNLMANLDTGGTIISALARRAGVTRQAASQQVAALEQLGYVERRPSETDGRAIVVHQTERGRRLLSDALDIVAELEVGYEAHLGAAPLAELKDLLRELLAHIDPIGELGRT